MTNDEAIIAIKELLAGMDGVTEGPWMRSGIRCKNPGDSLMVGPDGSTIYAIPIGRDHAGAFRDAGYLAQCSPANLRPILEAFLQRLEQ